MKFFTQDKSGNFTEVENAQEFFSSLIESAITRTMADQSRVVAAEVREQLELALVSKRFCPRPDKVTDDTVRNMWMRINKIGEGEYDRGIERCADGMTFILSWRKSLESITAWVGRIVVTAVVSAILGVIVVGWRMVR